MEVAEFNCCKVCSPEGYVAATSQEQFAAATLLVDATRQATGGSNLRASLMTFVAEWLEAWGSQALRKTMSHYGAIRRRTEGDDEKETNTTHAQFNPPRTSIG